MKRVALLFVVAVSACGMLCVGDAEADVFDLVALIDGAQANAGAGTGSPGTGSATMTFDDSTIVFAWDISWGGLLGTETVMHFHGPADPSMNAGVQVNFGAISGTTSPSIGSTTIDNAQAADLLNDLWYINIHTDQFPGGEIRGQVLLIPEPATVSMLLAALGGFLLCRRLRYRQE